MNWLGIFFAVGLFLCGVVPATSGAVEPCRVLFFSKSSGYEHDVIRWNKARTSHAETVIAQLAKKYNWTVTFSKDGRLFTEEQIDQFDTIVFYTTGDLTREGNDGFPPMPAGGKAVLLAAIAAGKGFVGIHCASDTFHSPGNEDIGPARFRNDGASTDRFIQMLGGEFIKHGRQQHGRLICVDRTFPGMEQVPEPFAPFEEWYSLKNFASDLHVIQVQETRGMKGREYDRPPYPATWARLHGEGRVFYSSMGHRQDIWTNPAFQSVLAGGVNWASRLVDADVTPNLQSVTPHAHVLPKP